MGDQDRSPIKRLVTQLRASKIDPGLESNEHYTPIFSAGDSGKLGTALFLLVGQSQIVFGSERKSGADQSGGGKVRGGTG